MKWRQKGVLWYVHVCTTFKTKIESQWAHYKSHISRVTKVQFFLIFIVSSISPEEAICLNLLKQVKEEEVYFLIFIVNSICPVEAICLNLLKQVKEEEI